MKKSVKAVLCLALVAILLVSLVACGGGVSGRYELTTMEANGQSIDIASLKALAGAEVDMYIELFDDGTGVLKMDTETTKMTYANGKIWPTDSPDEAVPFTVKGDTLTMEQDGVKLVFEK